MKVIAVALCAAFALLAASPAPTPTPAQVRTITLTPVELANAYVKECSGPLAPPYAHLSGTIFVGVVIRGQTICPAYQGLVRFDLDGLDAASIASAKLFYESKQNYNPDGSTERGHTLCVGAIGTTAASWTSDEKPISPPLDMKDLFRPARGPFKAPPLDVTAFLRAHLDDVKANGLVFNGALENLTARRCLAAIGQMELRLGISAAPETR
jgi:hypothetical protein